MATLPAAFLGHGTPMNALDHNRYTGAWSGFGSSVATPRAILMISAHWYINASAVTGAARPPTIHDFYGFPPELFSVQYPAPGSPEVAEEVVEVVKPTWVGLDHDSWGIDHGSWSVLVHAFPAADVPVIQLSVNAAKSFEAHLELGARLAPLRDRGVLIVGSGNVVHNLGRIEWGRPDAGTDWARRFDSDVRQVMTDAPADLVGMAGHPDFGLAAPTPDHFIPLLYLAGLAVAAGQTADVLVEGCAMGSLSMTSYTLGGVHPDPSGVESVEPGPARSGSPIVPDAPADETNL